MNFLDEPVRRELALVYRTDKALSRAAVAFMEIAVNRKVKKQAK
jgi:hypothetical protein